MNPRDLPWHGKWSSYSNYSETLVEQRARQFAALRGMRYQKSMAFPGGVNARNKRRNKQRRRRRRGGKAI